MISRQVFAPGVWTPKNPHHVGIHTAVTLRTYLYKNKEKFENFEETIKFMFCLHERAEMYTTHRRVLCRLVVIIEILVRLVIV